MLENRVSLLRHALNGARHTLCRWPKRKPPGSLLTTRGCPRMKTLIVGAMVMLLTTASADETARRIHRGSRAMAIGGGLFAAGALIVPVTATDSHHPAHGDAVGIGLGTAAVGTYLMWWGAREGADRGNRRQPSAFPSVETTECRFKGRGSTATAPDAAAASSPLAVGSATTSTPTSWVSSESSGRLRRDHAQGLIPELMGSNHSCRRDCAGSILSTRRAGR